VTLYLYANAELLQYYWVPVLQSPHDVWAWCKCLPAKHKLCYSSIGVFRI